MLKSKEVKVSRKYLVLVNILNLHDENSRKETGC